MTDIRALLQDGASPQAHARALLGSEHEAQDTVQDAWLLALDPSTRRTGDLLHWLRGTVRNLCRSRHRLAASERHRLAALASDGPAEGAAADVSAQRTEQALIVARALHALPSAYRQVIVLRYWDDLPPRAIGARLQLDTKVVRNRLYRGLAQLRAHLADPTNDSSATPALLAAALTPTSVKTTPALLSLMTLKTALLAPALILLVASVWFSGTGVEGEAPFSAPPAPLTGPAADAAPVRLAGPADPERGTPREAQPVPTPPPAQRPAAADPKLGQHADAASPLPPGRLHLTLVATESTAPPPPVTLRLLSAKKFAHLKQRTSPIDEALSAGSYDALILAPGYDPLELAAFEIISDRVTDLGPVSLVRGNADLEGVVRLPPALASQTLTVELHGIGRNACARCPSTVEICEHCGFGSDKSQVSVQAQETFGFHMLAAGDYQVAVRGKDSRLLFARELRLASGAREWLELDLDFVDIPVIVHGPDGRPFDGSWFEEGERYADLLRFYLWNNEVTLASAAVPPADPTWIAPVAEEDPSAEDPISNDSVSNDAAGAGAAHGKGEWAVRDRADGQRQQWHSLWPALLSPRPRLTGKPLLVTRTAPGRYRLRNVPVQANSIQLGCGPYFSRPADLDLLAWDGAPLEMTIAQRCAASSKLVETLESQPASCSACHTTPTAVFAGSGPF